jgi:hypothetical protein
MFSPFFTWTCQHVSLWRQSSSHVPLVWTVKVHVQRYVVSRLPISPVRVQTSLARSISGIEVRTETDVHHALGDRGEWPTICKGSRLEDKRTVSTRSLGHQVAVRNRRAYHLSRLVERSVWTYQQSGPRVQSLKDVHSSMTWARLVYEEHSKRKQDDHGSLDMPVTEAPVIEAHVGVNLFQASMHKRACTKQVIWLGRSLDARRFVPLPVMIAGSLPRMPNIARSDMVRLAPCYLQCSVLGSSER